MEDNKVIRFKDLPTRYPIFQTAVVWLLLDRFHPASWIRGSVWTIWALLWIGAVTMKVKEKQVPVEEFLKRTK